MTVSLWRVKHERIRGVSYDARNILTTYMDDEDSLIYIHEEDDREWIISEIKKSDNKDGINEAIEIIKSMDLEEDFLIN